MLISELSRYAGVPAKTIRYYETVGLMPTARREPNRYRTYAAADLERLRFVASARALGLSVAEIREIVAIRDQGIAPCQQVLLALDARLADLDHHLRDLLALRESLAQLRREGGDRPLDDVEGQVCVCHLIKVYGASGQVVVEHGVVRHDG